MRRLRESGGSNATYTLNDLALAVLVSIVVSGAIGAFAYPVTRRIWDRAMGRMVHSRLPVEMESMVELDDECMDQLQRGGLSSALGDGSDDADDGSSEDGEAGDS